MTRPPGRCTLILGGTGFLGSHVRAEAERRGTLGRLVVVGRRDGPTGGSHTFERCDTRDTDALLHLVERYRPDAVLHLASPLSAQLAGKDGRLLQQSILAGDLRWMDRLVRTNSPPRRLLVVGSAAEYGRPRRLPVRESDPCHPTTRYGRLKRRLVDAALQIGTRSALDVVAVRPFNVVGAGSPRGQLLGDVIARAQAALVHDNGHLRVDKLDHRRDFLAAKDAAAGIVDALLMGQDGQIYNLCSGQAMTVRDLVAIVVAEGPAGLTLLDGREPGRPRGVSVIYGSPAKARRAWGFQPKGSLHEAIRDAWESTRVA